MHTNKTSNENGNQDVLIQFKLMSAKPLLLTADFEASLFIRDIRADVKPKNRKLVTKYMCACFLVPVLPLQIESAYSKTYCIPF